MRILILSKDAPKYIYIILQTLIICSIFVGFGVANRNVFVPSSSKRGVEKGKGYGSQSNSALLVRSYRRRLYSCNVFRYKCYSFVVLSEADYVKVIIAIGCYFDEVILCGCCVLLSFSYVYNSAMDCSGFWVPMAVALLESVCKILSPPGFLCVRARFAMCSHHMQLSFIRTEFELRSIYHYLY